MSICFLFNKLLNWIALLQAILEKFWLLGVNNI